MNEIDRQTPYAERLATWQARNSLEVRPLTDDIRKRLALDLLSGKIRFRMGEGEAVGLEQQTHIPGWYTPIDLERGVVVADGEFQITDSPIAPAELLGMAELVRMAKRKPNFLIRFSL